MRNRRSSESEGESRGERRLGVGVEGSGLTPFLCPLSFSSPFFTIRIAGILNSSS